MIMKDVDRQLGKQDLERILKAILDLAEKSEQAKSSMLMSFLIQSLELSYLLIFME